MLSWNVPPSTTDPDALTHWGNRLDTHVQIKPGHAVPGDDPVISIIGGIGVADINVFGNGLTKPLATFALGGSPADPWLLNRECPFGGLVIVQGPPVLNRKYRLWVREFNNAATEEVVKNAFHVVNWLGVGSNITPNPVTGYATYMSTLDNMEQVLAHWVPPGDQLWQIRLEMATLGEVVLGTTPWHTIQSDNTGPRRRPAIAPFEPPAVTCEIHIDSGGDCKDFTQGTTIQGRFHGEGHVLRRLQPDHAAVEHLAECADHGDADDESDGDVRRERRRLAARHDGDEAMRLRRAAPGLGSGDREQPSQLAQLQLLRRRVLSERVTRRLRCGGAGAPPAPPASVGWRGGPDPLSGPLRSAGNRRSGDLGRQAAVI